MYEVIMPKLGLTMEIGKIERWLKKEGDRIEEGDILFEVMTDKVSLEVESYNSGVLKKITHFEGEDVPVTEVVAYIGGADEKIPDISAKTGSSLNSPEISPDRELKKEDGKTYRAEIKGSNFINTEIGQNISVNKKIFITPLARKTARDLNIDYKSIGIRGSGPRNRIIKDDILKYHGAAVEEKVKIISPVQAASVSSNTAGSVFKLQGIRKIIADKMVLSKHTIPHIIISAVANVSELVLLKEKIQKKADEIFQVKLTYTDFILKSAAMALRENIKLNSTLIDETVTVYDEINIGMAVAGEKGLIVPVIFNADGISVTSIAKKRIELIDKVKNNTINIDEISGATFTVSNLGMFRVRSFTAIINPPQTAILTIGEIYENLVMDKEKNIRQEHLMNLSVAVDHRAIDGYDSARYMQTLLNYLENPCFLY